mgnify:CR=1 FL=1
MTCNEIDTCLDVIDNIIPLKDWYPTVNVLKEHDVERNFEKFAPFLLYIQESMLNDDTASYSDSECRKRKETIAYISDLFSKNIAS